MTITIPPRLTSILAEATRIAPDRRKSSDGTVGDAAHRASGGDHNPDARGVVHAVDVSQSMPGTPYWQSQYDEFDAFAYARQIVVGYLAANPAERLNRWPWLADGGYIVWYEANRGYDVIFNPNVSLSVRQNGAAKAEHNQHVHFSIGHTVRSEQDTQPIFVEDDMPLTDADVNKLVAKLTPVIREQALAAVRNASGGYVDGKWKDGALFAELRKEHHLAGTD